VYTVPRPRRPGVIASSSIYAWGGAWNSGEGA
jgi:hypothetical protein